MGFYIVVSSITFAYKGRDALVRNGYRAFIEKAPRNISQCGCHYLIRVRDCTAETALGIMSRSQVPVLSSGSD